MHSHCGRKGLVGSNAQRPPQHTLSGEGGKQRNIALLFTQGCANGLFYFAQISYQLVVLLYTLGKAKARVYDYLLYACALGKGAALYKIVCNLFCDPLRIVAELLHCLRSSAHMHCNIGEPQFRYGREDERVCLSKRDVIYNEGPYELVGALYYKRAEGVYGDSGQEPAFE